MPPPLLLDTEIQCTLKALDYACGPPSYLIKTSFIYKSASYVHCMANKIQKLWLKERSSDIYFVTIIRISCNCDNNKRIALFPLLAS